MDLPIIIQVQLSERDAFNELRQANPDSIHELQSVGLTGEQLVTFLIELSVVTLPFATRIVLELIRARKHVSIKVDGVELSGISEKNAAELMAQLLER